MVLVSGPGAWPSAEREKAVVAQSTAGPTRSLDGVRAGPARLWWPVAHRLIVLAPAFHRELPSEGERPP